MFLMLRYCANIQLMFNSFIKVIHENFWKIKKKSKTAFRKAAAIGRDKVS